MSDEILRCTKCNARLAATAADQDGFEIPLCHDCYTDVMADEEVGEDE